MNTGERFLNMMSKVKIRRLNKREKHGDKGWTTVLINPVWHALSIILLWYIRESIWRRIWPICGLVKALSKFKTGAKALCNIERVPWGVVGEKIAPNGIGLCRLGLYHTLLWCQRMESERLHHFHRNRAKQQVERQCRKASKNSHCTRYRWANTDEHRTIE